MSDIPEFLKIRKKSKIEEIITHPVSHFIYGMMWFSSGLMGWYTQNWTSYFESVNMSPLIGLMIVGGELCVGYCLMGGNYEEFKKWIKVLHSISNVEGKND